MTTATLSTGLELPNRTTAVSAASHIALEAVSGVAQISESGAAAIPVVLTTKTQTLTNKTLTAPVIGDFSSSTHNHQAAAGGGTLDHGLALTGLADDDHTQYILVAGTRAFTGAQSLGGFKITSLGTPTLSTDAATKDYVDSQITGQDFKASVRVATTAALPTVTASGTGVGKTLTASAVGVLTVDGVATVLNDRILVKNQATGADNGIYKVTTEGTAGVAFVLTRATDADQDAEVTAGLVVPVAAGTVNADIQFMLTTNDTITVDTTSLTFSSFGALTDHGALLGLGDDDHTQYALLAGRSGGQSLIGGTAASNNLTLESTSHGTKGKVKVASGSNLELAGDDDFVPATNNTGEIGTDTFKFLRMRATTVVTGDLELRDEERGAHWRIREEPNRIVVVNETTGQRYEMVLREAA